MLNYTHIQCTYTSTPQQTCVPCSEEHMRLLRLKRNNPLIFETHLMQQSSNTHLADGLYPGRTHLDMERTCKLHAGLPGQESNLCEVTLPPPCHPLQETYAVHCLRVIQKSQVSLICRSYDRSGEDAVSMYYRNHGHR